MDNPETQAIVGTRHRMKTNKTKNHNIENKKEEQHEPPPPPKKKPRGEPRCSRRLSISSFLFTIFLS